MIRGGESHGKKKGDSKKRLFLWIICVIAASSAEWEHMMGRGESRGGGGEGPLKGDLFWG